MSEHETDNSPDEETAQNESSEDEADQIHRRGFFREGFRQLLKPLAEAMEKRVENLDLPDWATEDERPRRYGSGSLDQGGPKTPGYSSLEDGRTLLRPPGALPEEEFLERCVASGSCVHSCPVSAIRLVVDADERKHNKPCIDPDIQACVICEDLSCMKACPTGALQLVPATDIDMGVAEVDVQICVRSEGEDCQICVDKCPIGPRAIDILRGDPSESEGDVKVYTDGCTGCGVCQMYCPTEPRAIVVRPRAS